MLNVQNGRKWDACRDVSSLHHGRFKGFQAGRKSALMPLAESAEGE